MKFIDEYQKYLKEVLSDDCPCPFNYEEWLEYQITEFRAAALPFWAIYEMFINQGHTQRFAVFMTLLVSEKEEGLQRQFINLHKVMVKYA